VYVCQLVMKGLNTQRNFVTYCTVTGDIRSCVARCAARSRLRRPFASLKAASTNGLKGVNQDLPEVVASVWSHLALVLRAIGMVIH
jgi:hypothetical protein